MNKNIIKAVSVLGLASALSTSATAADFGMAAGISGTDNSEIRGIIKLDDSMRLEPYAAFNYSDPDLGASNTNLKLGAAFHMLQPVSTNTALYYGGYLDFSTSATSLYNDVNLGPVAGVEYKFAKEFSVAGEVALNFGFGNGTQIATNTTAVLRYYF